MTSQAGKALMERVIIGIITLLCGWLLHDITATTKYMEKADAEKRFERIYSYQQETARNIADLTLIVREHVAVDNERDDAAHRSK